MIPGDVLMQVPPHPLDRVEVRGVGRQQVHLNPPLPLPEVLDHLQAGVTARIVADHVDLLVPPQPPPQLVQVLEEQGAVAPLLGGPLRHEHLAGPPMDRPREVPFLVRPGCFDLRLVALGHPHPADLGVGVDLDLVLPDHHLILGQVLEQLPQFGELDPPLLFVRLEDRPGSSVDQVAAMEPAADRLPTGRYAFALAEQEGQQGAGPATAEEAKIARGLGGHPGHEDGDPTEAQPKGAAAFPAGEPGDPLGLEPLEPAVDGARATKKVHPAEARAGLERGGHADSTWSCVRGLQIGRSACPPACCITPSASAAISTPAPTTTTAKPSSPSTKIPRPAAAPPAGRPRSTLAVRSSAASEPSPSAAAPPSSSCPSRASNAWPVASCDRSRSRSPTRAAATPKPSSGTPSSWAAA